MLFDRNTNASFCYNHDSITIECVYIMTSDYNFLSEGNHKMVHLFARSQNLRILKVNCRMNINYCVDTAVPNRLKSHVLMMFICLFRIEIYEF